MIRRIKRPFEGEEVLSLLHPVIREWFESKFERLSPPQAYAVPLVHRGRNLLVASPTGSGKTLTAFLSIINELFSMGIRGDLEDRVYCVYISPLKALANDIEKNLNRPLAEIYALAESKGLELPEIRVHVRTGDTSAYEKQKMVRKPPHILITTPESLAIVLSTIKFRTRLEDVRWVILDEIHEIANSKRGSFLTLSMERLAALVGRPIIRIGLSATQSPIEEIGRFLVGREKGKARDVDIVEIGAQKALDFRVICPVSDMTSMPYEVVNAKMYDTLVEQIRSHRTTLVFTNTRSGAETVVHKLKERGIERIAAHHGSLSKETRLEVEDLLKEGKMEAVVTSTSLELGIDIGYIDLVTLIGSPKSIAKGLQRIGRAGHALHETSKGRITVFDMDDLVESVVLIKKSYEGRIDRTHILKNPLDVLAQTLIGMSLEKRWEVEDAYDLVKRAYPYRNLSKTAFKKVLEFISGRYGLADEGVYGKVWYDPDEERFGLKRGTRMLYFMNIGTIPQESGYHVFMESGMPLGDLAEKFVERLRAGDIFLLGGRTYELTSTQGNRLYVKDARGRKPTVPSWAGEMLPRSFDLSLEICRFRRAIAEKLAGTNANNETVIEGLEDWLMEEHLADPGSARTIVNYFLEQRSMIETVPTDRDLLVEGYRDGDGNWNMIFHFCFGRRVNDALSRAYAYVLSRKYKCNVRVSLTDDNFMLTFPKMIPLKGMDKVLTPKTLPKILRDAVKQTELFHQRFRHCAARSFMVLRNYRGHEISVRKQFLRSHRVLNVLQNWNDFPVIEETYNEVMNDVMDLENATEVLKWLTKGDAKISYSEYSLIPSPFSHNVVLMGMSDIVMMEDRSSLLRELHRQVLSKVIETEDSKYKEPFVEEFFRAKRPMIAGKGDLLDYVNAVGAANLFIDRGENPFGLSDEDRDTVEGWAAELAKEGRIASVWVGRPMATEKVLETEKDDGKGWGELRWIPKADVPAYATLYAITDPPTEDEEKALAKLEEGKKLPKRALLMALERKYLAGRTGRGDDGKFTYAKRKPRTMSLEAAAEKVIKSYLAANGPMMLEEIAVGLHLEEEMIKHHVSDMEERGMVKVGHYIMTKGTPQYLLTVDDVALERIQRGRFGRHAAIETFVEEEEPAFDEGTGQAVVQKVGRSPGTTAAAKPQGGYAEIVEKERVDNYIKNIMFTEVEDLDAFFDHYQAARATLDIFHRVKEFDPAGFGRRLGAGEVLQGRFVGGHVCYMRKEDILPYVLTYRQADLGPAESEVLELIGENPGITKSGLAELTKMRKIALEDILDRLDRNLYVYRMTERYGAWNTINKYAVLEIDEEWKGEITAEAEVILRFLRTFGIAPLIGIRYYLRLSHDVIAPALAQLEEKGLVKRVLAAGHTSVEMYLPTEGMEPLMEAQPLDHGLKVLMVIDPYSLRIRTEITSRFGEGWYYVAVRNGKLIGAIHLWPMSGCLDIRDIIVEEEDLPEILDGLGELLEYYRYHFMDVIRVRQVMGKPVPELDKATIKVFKDRGYFEFDGKMISGNVDPSSFEKDEVLRYVFGKQHLDPDGRFANAVQHAVHFGPVRSDYELALRVKGKPVPLDDLHRSTEFPKALLIPSYFMLCTYDDLIYYRAAKAAEMDGPMRHVLKLVPEFGIKRTKLYNASNMSNDKFNETLKRLYDGLHVIRDSRNRYTRVETPDVPVEEAREWVIRKIFERFGIASAEKVAMMIKNEFSMRDIRSILQDLVDQEYLVKGFFTKGSDTLLWVLKDDLETIGGADFDRAFVLSPKDELFRYIQEDVRREFGLSNAFVVFDGLEMVGAFSATSEKGTLNIKEFIGDWRRSERIIDRFAYRIGVEVLVTEPE